MSDDPKLPTDRSGNFTARQREFIRLYTDPTMPCFMNGAASARQAGYADTSAAAWSACIMKPHVEREIDRIFTQRIEAGQDLIDRMYAKRNMAIVSLIESMQIGQDMSVVNPESEFGEGMKDVIQPVLDEEGNVRVDEKGQPVLVDYTKRLKEINHHNRNVINAKREARQAAELLTAYNVGAPEQVIRHKSDKTPDKRTLEGMGDDALLDVQAMLEKELEDRKGKAPRRLSGEDENTDDAGPVDEADYEIVD